MKHKSAKILIVFLGLLFGIWNCQSTASLTEQKKQLWQAFSLYEYSFHPTSDHLLSWYFELQNLEHRNQILQEIDKQLFSPPLIMAHRDTSILFNLLARTFDLNNRLIQQLDQSSIKDQLHILNQAALVLARLAWLQRFNFQNAYQTLLKDWQALQPAVLKIGATLKDYELQETTPSLEQSWERVKLLFWAQPWATQSHSFQIPVWLFVLFVFFNVFLAILWLTYRKRLQQIWQNIQKFTEAPTLSPPPRTLNQLSKQIQEGLRQLKQQQVELSQQKLQLQGKLQTQERQFALLEEELQQLKNLHSIFWQQLPVALAFVSDTGRLQKVNPIFCQWFRLNPQELLDRQFTALFAPENQKMVLPFLDKTTNGSTVSNEHKLQLWHGQTVWWKISAFPSSNTQRLIVIEDFTRWIRKLHELSQREKHFRLLFNQANDPVFVNQLTSDNRFGRFIEVNKKAIETYLYSREEFDYLNPLTLIPPEHLKKHEEITQRLIKEKHVIYEIEYFRKDKRRIPVEINAHLFEYRNQPTVLSIVRDVSERKRAQEALKRFGLQLRSLASRLQDIREEERTMIAREIHDELGQLLTVLKIEISLLCKQFAEKNEQVQLKVSTISDLISQAVLTIQQITSKLRPGILDEVGLVAALEWQTEEFSKHTGIPCKVHFPREEIELDRERATALFRIFQESLTNIARHAQAKRVSVFLKRLEEKVVLEVVDNGLGINRQQIESPQSLGLLGMRERAMVFGGHLEIHGVPGQGTRVKVELPLKE